MERIQRLLQQQPGMSMQPGVDAETMDTAEVVHISSLALLKVFARIFVRRANKTTYFVIF
jgi:hypothetical protein